MIPNEISAAAAVGATKSIFELLGPFVLTCYSNSNETYGEAMVSVAELVLRGQARCQRVWNQENNSDEDEEKECAAESGIEYDAEVN